MLARSRSLSTLLISSFVAVATVFLLIYALLNAVINRNNEIDRLNTRLTLTTEQLQTSIAAALWTIDKPQVERVLDAAMKDRVLTAVVVKTNDSVYARSRDDRWRPVTGEPARIQSGSLTKELPILFDGEQLGTITLTATTNFLRQQIATNSLYLLVSILLLDFLLIYCLYYILNRSVLRPLKNLERYAVSVSSGERQPAPLDDYVFRGELDVLRLSLGTMVSLLDSRYTELKGEAKRFYESEKRYRTLVNTIPDMIWLKDSDGVYLSCNKMFERFIGASESDICGKTDYDFVDKETADSFREHDRKAMAAGRPCRNEEWIVFADDGHRALLDTIKTPMLDEEGRIVGVLGIGHDITALERKEEALRESNQRMQLATDSAHLAVWDWDLLSGTMIWDDQMFEFYGTTRQESNGTLQDWKDGLHPEDLERAIRECEATIRGEAPFDTEFRVRHRDGTVRWIKANAKVLRDQEGTPVRMVGINRDVTEARQAEAEKSKLQAQLLQSQKMESLGTLAGGVAHDMNNVLGAILGLASAHIESQPPGSPLYQALGTICKATERGGKMVKSLLNFARHSPAKNNKLDLNAILREEVALLERTTLSKVRLDMDLEGELRPILGDASALAHAFMNLCVNAVDAMPENGILTLHTRNIDQDWVEVMVEDNGIGMPKAVLEKAMDPFFTTKETGRGTGLGLSMVFSTVKAHRGQMTIQSEPGQGTLVILRFPTCEQEPAVQPTEPAKSQDPRPSPRSLKVLLVDDDELIQISCQASLEALGHTAVDIARSGEEALDVLEAGLEPDLVILDMNMPGLGGTGTLPRLRMLHPKVPVLLSTGRTDQAALTLASAHPGVTLLPKPFSLREFQAHLESIGLG